MSGIAIHARRSQQGLTLLEVMIVLAIIGLAVLLVGRVLKQRKLIDDAEDLASVLRRTSEITVESGELHRVLFDLDKGVYLVEICEGSLATQRNEDLNPDKDKKKELLDRAKTRLANLPIDAFAAGDPEEATKRVTALAGQHVADRTCAPQPENELTGDATGQGWQRKLGASKLKRIAVAHRDDPVTKGQIAVYFFPMGSSEKTVIELTDDDETYSVLVHGLTGQVELRDSEIKSIDDYMLKNIMGDKNARREDQP